MREKNYDKKKENTAARRRVQEAKRDALENRFIEELGGRKPGIVFIKELGISCGVVFAKGRGFAIVDVHVFEELQNAKLYPQKRGGYLTVCKGGKTTTLQRYVNKTPKGLVTDHINDRTWDCRKENLRSLTNRENQKSIKDGKLLHFE